ncbi:MAG TPA: cupredoxin domain-containing protein [Allosphingosinicella sp.]
MRNLVILIAAAAASPASAQPPQAATVTVRLSNFDFTPATIRLPAGRPIVLRLVNTASGGHDFSSPAFFAAARIDPASAGRVRRGGIEVRGRSSVELRLVPAAGRYRLRCTHLFHSTFGMTGAIVVE